MPEAKIIAKFYTGRNQGSIITPSLVQTHSEAEYNGKKQINLKYIEPGHSFECQIDQNEIISLFTDECASAVNQICGMFFEEDSRLEFGELKAGMVDFNHLDTIRSPLHCSPPTVCDT